MRVLSRGYWRSLSGLAACVLASMVYTGVVDGGLQHLSSHELAEFRGGQHVCDDWTDTGKCSGTDTCMAGNNSKYRDYSGKTDCRIIPTGLSGEYDFILNGGTSNDCWTDYHYEDVNCGGLMWDTTTGSRKLCDFSQSGPCT